VPGEEADGLAVLRRRKDWVGAVEHFEQLAATYRGDVDQRARDFGGRYANDRAALVVDVVLSNQRKYETIVDPLVTAWMAANPAMTLDQLAVSGPGPLARLRKDKWADEEATIQKVGAGLVAYCKDHQLNELSGIRRWADDVDPLRYTWKLDPYVGSVRGIGVALFAYLRMLCGADAIKPDTRVRGALACSGVTIPATDAAALFVAEALAEELHVGRLWFDQLLWYAPVPPRRRKRKK
jgi:hypothetical protein